MKNSFYNKLHSLKTAGCLLFLQFVYFDSLAQSLAINTTGAIAHPSALFDVSSLNKGILIPRISLTDINDVTTIAAPANSLLVYNTNAAITGGSGTGYYYFTGTVWVKMIDNLTPLTGWATTGNAGTTAGTNYLGTTDLADLVIKTNGVENMRILNASGNVGIGTPSPLRKLQVNGDSRFQNNAYIDNNFFYYGSNNTNTTFYKLAGIDNANSMAFGDLTFNNITRFFLGSSSASLGLSFQASGNPNIIYLDGFNGRMGIGTGTPSTRLQVNGDTRHSGNTYVDNNFFHYGSNTTNTTFYKLAGIDNANSMAFGDLTFNNITRFFLGSSSASLGLSFQATGNPNIIYLDGFNGRVGIGTGTPSTRLQVNGDTRYSGNTYVDNNFFHYSSNTTNTTFYKLAGIDNANSMAFGDISFNNITRFFLCSSSASLGLSFQATGKPNIIYLDGFNGRVGIGTGVPAHKLELSTDDAAKPGTNTWTVVSDIRMKQNIHPYKDGLSKLLLVNPIEYNYNERSGYDTRPSYVGLVAQDLQKIAPYMVGKFEKDGKEYLDINTSAMTYMMINAIKEQQKMIDDLKKEIEALKKK